MVRGFTLSEDFHDKNPKLPASSPPFCCNRQKLVSVSVTCGSIAYKQAMNESMTDQELLRQYAEKSSESAFRSLVGRHMNLVFSTALRGLNDAAVAAEITQNVFITLARKSHWLCGETTIAPWLHKATLLEIRQWWRGEFRRQRREQTAVELNTVMKDDDSLLKALEGELDDGLLTLREAERTALILRYFEGLSHKEIGARVGAREDAVRMRINKALERLTEFFRRRGYSVPAVTTTSAALAASTKAAPAGFAALAASSALRAAGTGSAGSFKLLIAKLTCLSQPQTTVLCVALIATPIAWQWHMDRATQNSITTNQAALSSVREQQSQTSTEVERLRSESARLDSEIADATQNQARYTSAGKKLEALKARVHDLLTNNDYRWPNDLPYVRVAKSEVRSLDLLHKPGTFGEDGVLNNTAREMLGITASEEAPVEQALANYWRGVFDMMNESAYQTNIQVAASGRETATVVVPPLGDALKTLAKTTASQLSDILGEEREQLLFGDWAQGGIRIFSPGNLWLIGDRPQIFTVWIDPNSATGKPNYGSGWHVDGSGVSSGDNGGIGIIPSSITQKFFVPWLNQHGIAVP